DFMDNIFVPNISISPDDLSGINFKDLKKEGHLMVANPEEWIKKLIKLRFKRIMIHVEIEGNIHDYISEIKGAGCEAVLAINPHTPISQLEPYAKELDGILVMGVVPGFQGQEFIPGTLDKIKEIKSKGWQAKISVDGAVKDRNAKDIIESGADTLILGSFLIKGDPDQNLEILLKSLRWVIC
ncbi:MAG: ribulose-phosphate 3-epimerase, partial [Candidatus Daviesbacteria bacterium]|nr:ribulose-phosphate 3-epimerase [Candidatus Daviesbacteria bacterium]